MKNHELYFKAVDKLNEEDFNIAAEAYTDLEGRYYEAIDKVKKLEEDNKRLQENFNELFTQLKDCNSELCLKCGAYRDGGLIACEHCRWY